MLICSSVNLFIVKVPSLEESKVLLAKDPGKR